MIDEEKIQNAATGYAFEEGYSDTSIENIVADKAFVDFESRINKAHFYSITDESATYGTAKKP